MRWLLLKDLQVLRRSPLVAALLIGYPIVVALLIGIAVSGSPSKPRVAFLNETGTGDQLSIGNRKVDLLEARGQLESRVDLVRVKTRAEAVEKVRSGDVLGALIIPADTISKLETGLQVGGLAEPPKLEVLVNDDDPVKARLVDDQISALVAEANLRLSREFSKVTLNYLDLLLKGGHFDLLGQSFDVLGLEKTRSIIGAVSGDLPPAEQHALQQVEHFAALAAENLDLANNLLASVSQPISVDKQRVGGSSPPLDAFAVGLAVSVSMMFVTVLLVAGSLALEREENAYPRLLRGLIGQTGLLAEKIALGIVCALAVTLVLLVVLTPFVALEWTRAPLWLVAAIFAAAGFGALGAALGAAAREVRASSLLAFMLALPIALISLIPSGAAGATLEKAASILAGLFPFKPALDALTAALSAGGAALWLPLLHLAALTLAYGVLARLALGRFAR